MKHHVEPHPDVTVTDIKLAESQLAAKPVFSCIFMFPFIPLELGFSFAHFIFVCFLFLLQLPTNLSHVTSTMTMINSNYKLSD